MDAYIEKHFVQGEYTVHPDVPNAFENAQGWTDYRIGPHIVFAHRRNGFTAANFRDSLHVHDYCEVLFWCEGDVQYVSGDRAENPKTGSVIVIPPGELHTTRLLRDSLYDRYVLYFSPDAFALFGAGWSTCLQSGSRAFAEVLSDGRRTAVYEKLSLIEERLSRGDASAEVGAYSAVIEVLLLLCEVFSSRDGATDECAETRQYLPEPIRAIRRYIEENYQTLTTVEAVAARFYYTREYVSRLFRRYYNLSPGDYIEQCRIREAEKRIAAGEKIADVCFAVGYRSISAFSSAFRRVTGKPPSAFRRRG